jgi:[acyl-carrier-protein] S-malonyltransferase
MGRDLAEAFPLARQSFEEADEALGFRLSHLCWEGSADELTLTMNAQPAILVHTIAVWRVLQQEGRLPAIALAAGHSLGEFSAYVAAGALSFADAVRVVRRRGELMYSSGTQRPGTMAALLGLEDEDAEALCKRASAETGGIVIPANYNSPGQLVISGDVAAVEKAAELAPGAGARRVIPLNVSGAFHSPLMENAVDGLRDTLDALEVRSPDFPVVSNVTAEPVDQAESARELLVRQLTSPVRWVDSMRTMRTAGVEEFLEIGPGNVLSGLLRRIDRAASSVAVGTAEEVMNYSGKED